MFCLFKKIQTVFSPFLLQTLAGQKLVCVWICCPAGSEEQTSLCECLCIDLFLSERWCLPKTKTTIKAWKVKKCNFLFMPMWNAVTCLYCRWDQACSRAGSPSLPSLHSLHPGRNLDTSLELPLGGFLFQFALYTWDGDWGGGVCESGGIQVGGGCCWVEHGSWPQDTWEEQTHLHRRLLLVSVAEQ